MLSAGYGLAGILTTALANGVRSRADPAREPGLVLPLFGVLRAGARPTILLRRIQGEDLVTVGESDRSALANATAVLGGPMSTIVVAGSVAAYLVSNKVPIVRHKIVRGEFRGAKAKQLKARADIGAIEGAAFSFAAGNMGRYPDSFQDLVTPDENGSSYLGQTDFPLDPWGNPYGYEPRGAHDRPRVFSLGADGTPGGEGEDQDIDNLQFRR